MARLSRFLAVAVLLGGVTVSLSACTGDPAPTASPSPSPAVVSETPSPSPSPSPTALSEDELLALIPENARPENFGGATNFALHFLSEYPRILTGPTPDLFSLVTASDCIFCNTVKDRIDSSFEPGDSLRGGEVESLQTVADGGLQADGSWSVSFDATIGDLERVNSSGDVVDVDAGGSVRVTVILKYDEHWIVLGVGADKA